MMTATRQSSYATHTARLRSDQRGAVMVVGVFMAVFLVGALWYIIGIGDVIVYRERMQDGADAVAFAGAVYHARGMNIIAMINIIMAATLALLVGVKLVQVLNNVAMAVFCAAEAAGAPTAGEICTFTTGLVSEIEPAVQEAETFVNETLPVLSQTQAGVAVAMPWVAQEKAKEVATSQYAEPAQGGGFVSTSLVSSEPEDRLGLPVQEDEYGSLCGKAKAVVQEEKELVYTPFDQHGSEVEDLTGKLVGIFPDYFCAPGSWQSSDVDEVNTAVIDKLAREACEESPAGADPTTLAICISQKTLEINAELETVPGGESGVTDTDEMTPKKVFSEAKNGDGYFQIWSVMVGDDEWPKRAEEGVKIAAWDKSVVVPDETWGKVAFAQAEFYYDDAGAWANLQDDAMWNMLWRARLRRVRAPDPTIASIVAGATSGGAMGSIDANAAAAFGAPEMAWLLGGQGPEALEQAVEPVFKGGSPFESEHTLHPNLETDGEIKLIH